MQAPQSQMARFLLPEERILWQGQPDVIFLHKRKFRAAWTYGVLTVLAMPVLLGLITLREHPNTSLLEIVGSVAQLALLISIPVWPLFIIDWRRQPRIHANLMQQPPVDLYGVTNMRLLVLYSTTHTLSSVPLDSIQISRKKNRQGFGSILAHVQLDSATGTLYMFLDIADVETVYQLILDAQKSLGEHGFLNVKQ